jgi:hypothetical protein
MLGLLILAVGAPLLAGCGLAPTPTADLEAATAKPTIEYRMAQVKTATPLPSPTPAVSPTSRPTATWVPVPTSPPVAENQAPTKADVARIDPAQAWPMLQAGEAVLVDVRVEGSYAEEHAKGAISMPIAEVPARAETLPPDKLVIFYCA